MYPSCIIVEGVCRKQHIAAGRPELGRMSQNIRTRVKTRVTTRPLAFVVNVVREGVCLSVVHFSFSLFLCCVCVASLLLRLPTSVPCVLRRLLSGTRLEYLEGPV